MNGMARWNRLATGHGFFGRLGSIYRYGSAELASLLQIQLPKKQTERLALWDQLTDLQLARNRLCRSRRWAQSCSKACGRERIPTSLA